MEFKTISVIGLGYIGLPTAAMLASRKINVIGVDVNPGIVEAINQGKIHVIEPDLDMVVHTAVQEGYLSAKNRPEPADAFLIAVPTPFKGEDHEPDLKFIKSAAESIAAVLKKGDLVILESTSPVGTSEEMAAWLAAARPDLSFPATHGEESDIRVAHCPERVLPGNVMRELIENDRVIGGLTPKCSSYAVALYKIFVEGDCVVTNARTAEMAKLTENSFRDVNIAFANELSTICNELNIDVWELIRLANRHPRVNILQPGPGVGGHCIAVDPWFIVSKTPEQARLIKVAREVNDSKPKWVIDQVKIAISEFLQNNPSKTIKDVVVACYGLAFKPDIDDLRESPALEISKKIVEMHKGKVLLIEPNIERIEDSKNMGSLVDFKLALQDADIHLLLVDHKEFKTSEKIVFKENSIILDMKGVWSNDQ